MSTSDPTDTLDGPDPQRIVALVARQLDSLFLIEEGEAEQLDALVRIALDRSRRCFSRINNKYFYENGRIRFSPYHSGQYTIFLYFLSRAASGTAEALADKIYYLNKTLNGLDLYHQVEMPDVFFTDHPVGSVIGRGRFGDRFMFAQNCTVGNNRGCYPSLGRDVYMMVGSKIIGDCKIGDDVVLAANTCVLDQDVPSGHLVFGASPDLLLKPLKPRHRAQLNFFLPEGDSSP